ncbi:iron chaperone [Secundilactobacillus folii]|uniref:YdhG-like domain-containing protein n=1 Tax=Secundilactobacillus folii TaxID=2678357 RepID=A0A7X2XWD1_9LACO|nr:DUF1801 domain-containing protein [Secundilactobacillus folii]MTV81501.1 hypothetical protein [Secundilactobacillus folii]
MSVITDYIAEQPAAQQAQLHRVYSLLKQALPAATEAMGYGMPVFKQPTALIYFAANKKHIGIYPTSEGMNYFATELTPYVTTKGSWHLDYDQELPAKLIVAMAKHRLSVVTGA